MSDNSLDDCIRIDEIADRFEAAWEAGPRPMIEDYLDAEDGPECALILEELLRVEREMLSAAGLTPDPADYHRRFPAYAEIMEAFFSHDSKRLRGGPAVSTLLASAVAPPIRLRNLPDDDTSLDAPPPAIPSDSPIEAGRYRLLGEIAQGGMGSVLKGQDRELGRTLAIKVLLDRHRDDPEMLRRFAEEAQIGGQLEHPGIVPLHDVGRFADHRPFFTMKLVKGTTLAAELRARPTPAHDLPRFLGIFEQICLAMAYTHARGVIHRDLKPANIMVGRFGEVQVMDWGIAKVLDQGDADNGPGAPPEQSLIRTVLTDTPRPGTRSGSVVGTPAYMPPEQARGDVEQVDERSDVFCLGAILCEILTGRPPYLGRTGDAAFRQARRSDLSDALARVDASGADEELLPLARSCLAANPADRPRDAGVVAGRMTAYLAGVQERLRSAEIASREARARAEEEAKRRVLADQLASEAEARAVAERRRRRMTAAAGVLAASLLLAVVAIIEMVAIQQANTLKRDSLENKRLAKAREMEVLSEAQRRLAETRLADWCLERGFALSEQGEVGRGLLWMARGLTGISSEDPVVQRPFRINLGAWKPMAHALEACFETPSGFNAVAFNPDRKHALTVSVDTIPGDLRVLDAATGEAVGPPLGQRARVKVVEFSPNGRLAFTGSEDKTSQLWEVASGQPVGPRLSHESPVLAVAFSRDSRRFVTGGNDKVARLWDASNCQPIGPGIPQVASIKALAFRPDGKVILVGCEDGSSRLWDIATRNQIGPPLVQGDQVFAAAFSPDGKLVLTGGLDKTAKLWDASTGDQLVPAARHTDQVKAVAFSPDGSLFATGGMDRIARLWDTATGTQIGPSLPHRDWVITVAFSPDGERLVTATGRGLHHWRIAKPRLVGKPLPHRTGRVPCVAFSPDGKLALTGGVDWTARLWDTATGEPVGQPLAHDGAVFSLAFSRDGTKMLTAGDTGGRLWDVRTRTPIGPPLHHTRTVRTTAFSPDGRLALTGSDDTTAKLWDTSTGKQFGPPLKQGEVKAAAFSPDGQLVLTGGTETRSRLWDVATGRQVGVPIEHGNWVQSVAFSPDGKLMLIGAGHIIHFWNPETRRPVGQALRHNQAVPSVAFSRDGKYAVTGSLDGFARLWDVATQELIGRPLDAGGPVNLVRFSPDGKLVMTGSFNRRVRFWDTATGQPVGPALEHAGWVLSMAFSPDGKLALTSTEDNAARLWTVPSALQDTPREIVLECELENALTIDKYNAILEISCGERQGKRRELDRLRTSRH